VEQIHQQVQQFLSAGCPAQPRSSRYAWFLEKMAQVDTSEQISPSAVQQLYQGESA
jgi:malonate decarboxylase beta subunit